MNQGDGDHAVLNADDPQVFRLQGSHDGSSWTTVDTQTNRWNQLNLSDRDRGLAVITTGIAKNHYLECLPELNYRPSHLHIGSYPLPVGMIRMLAAHSPRIMVLEDGYPFVERRLRGLMPSHLVVEGRGSGKIE